MLTATAVALESLRPDAYSRALLDSLAKHRNAQPFGVFPELDFEADGERDWSLLVTAPDGTTVALSFCIPEASHFNHKRSTEEVVDFLFADVLDDDGDSRITLRHERDCKLWNEFAMSVAQADRRFWKKLDTAWMESTDDWEQQQDGYEGEEELKRREWHAVSHR